MYWISVGDRSWLSHPLDLECLAFRTPASDDDRTPQSLASSQTVVGTSLDPNTGDKRKRAGSPSDSARNNRPFVAGSDGCYDNSSTSVPSPHHLTVGPTTLCDSQILNGSIGP